jgi:hypothetical protein
MVETLIRLSHGDYVVNNLSFYLFFFYNNMKGQKCVIRLHGIRREILTGEFESVAAAKRWIQSCWDRPYTIVKIK